MIKVEHNSQRSSDSNFHHFNNTKYISISIFKYTDVHTKTEKVTIIKKNADSSGS